MCIGICNILRPKNTPVQTIWLNELEKFESAYDKWLLNLEDNNGKQPKTKNIKNSRAKSSGAKSSVAKRTGKTVKVNTK